MIKMKLLIRSRSNQVMKFLRYPLIGFGFHRGFSKRLDCMQGKVALVTGAAQGLGKASSDFLLSSGAKVCLADNNKTGGMDTLMQFEEKYGKDNVMFNQCDVTKTTQMKRTFEVAKQKLGGLDIVINSAGTVGEMENMWETTVDINLKGTIRGTHLGIEHMRKDKGGNGGVIVNIASMVGMLAVPFFPVFAATKSGIIMFSQCLAQDSEMTANGIRINVLAPALINTDVSKPLYHGSLNYVPHLWPDKTEIVGVSSTEEVAVLLFELVCDANKNGAILKIAKNPRLAYQAMSREKD